MLQNEHITIDQIKEYIDNLILSSKLNKLEYSDEFYLHLNALLRFHLAIPNQHYRSFQFTERNYLGLEQFILENSELLEQDQEAQDIDWNLIDDAKDMLRTKIRTLVGYEATSEYLNPFIVSTIDSFEFWLIYSFMHPGSFFNPWIPTCNILQKGYIYFTSDDADKLTEYQKDIYKNVKSSSRGNLGLVTRSRDEKKFSGFIVDNRHDSQILVNDYLTTHASGREHAKSLGEIQTFLQSQDRDIAKNDMRTNILLPLKRAGLIGSYSRGYFYIATSEDLIQTYESHLEKFRGLKKTLEVYEKRAKAFGIESLTFS